MSNNLKMLKITFEDGIIDSKYSNTIVVNTQELCMTNNPKERLLEIVNRAWHRLEMDWINDVLATEVKVDDE